MMRPMKLAGSQLLFGDGCLAHLRTLPYKRAMIVIGGSSMKKNGILATVQAYLAEAGAQTEVLEGVEPDPSLNTVLRGKEAMERFQPDLIVALGGGSAMDAAKMMWVFYEAPQLQNMQDVLSANPFPTLRKKARLCCIPSTAGTASEVSRSVVITENGLKHGVGNMEMMPDIAICDPRVTVSMPKSITAETGMDALTHALEALVSQRANYVSDILAEKAVLDIFATLHIAYADGNNIAARETMLNASMIAGMAFTNVSLGIVHSMAHTIGGLFHVAHGLADAVLLPYIIRFNAKHSPIARERYAAMAHKLGVADLAQSVAALNAHLGIPETFQTLIPDIDAYTAQVSAMAELALQDGCTKTNPIIPTLEQLRELFALAYTGGATGGSSCI